MLHLSHKNTLEKSKNLLAFSAGVDSSALFFLLLENHIQFDIAIVNYGMRQDADTEVAHAKALAKKYKCFCHHIKAPSFDTHFEKKARDFRYGFFESLISTEGYDTLLTAHQLNDQLEWFLMRLSKGAGVSELLGLEVLTQKKNYLLMRPLLEHSKDELFTYLKKNNYPYFIDASNTNEKYERNKFRKHFSDPLITGYKEGIKRSFGYLKKDKKNLEKDFEIVYVQKKLYLITLHTLQSKVKASDLTLKKLGYVLSASQRQEIEKESALVIAGLWAIELQNNMLYIAPYSTAIMPKKFKENCRLLNIPKKIRAYCFEKDIDLDMLSIDQTL
ncbi:MAG: tRNA lysidine(34) synthetase TilS [Epsilonproteobacteria bacterium]|nr:MAG: tRNA lysidine(34) synthetase TilS [Campylobacterota bacterium]